MRSTQCGLLAATIIAGAGAYTTTAVAAPLAKVTLLNAGKGPKKKLRFRPKVGALQDVEMSMETSIGMKMGHIDLPKTKTPGMAFKMNVRVASVAKNNDIRYEFEYTDAQVMPSPGSPPQLVEMMKQQIGQLKGIKGYGVVSDTGHTKEGRQELSREQVQIGDMRSLDEIMLDLMQHDYIPSFCTSCYRQGRTGEQFMEFAIPGFIEEFCTPNALLTLAEYLQDYASEETRAAGLKLIKRQCALLDTDKQSPLQAKIDRVLQNGERDIYL